MDAGCEWECYASDIIRTFPLSASGWPSKETEKICALVEEMQERRIEMLRPGVWYLDAFYVADRIAAEGLIRLDIFKSDIDELLKSGTNKAVFPHGLGHHMGLDVHDDSAKPILSSHEERVSPRERQERLKDRDDFQWKYAPCTRDAALLEPGMVITVEPGICTLPPMKLQGMLLT